MPFGSSSSAPPPYPGHVNAAPTHFGHNEPPPPYSGRDNAPSAPPRYQQTTSDGLPRMSQSLINFLEQHAPERGQSRTNEPALRPGESRV